ncbi:MAG: PAS domain S-box protein [Syntrophomonadaceae bacterium]|nr:PAS domain S-box protein [Syntrophomonadaceae bacterium]MDD3899288.1 PAS domain S-box protein [Syntrophomonadaceae bacterium]
MHCAHKTVLLNEEPLFPSGEEYRLIAENAQDMIIVIDPKTLVFKYVSPSNMRIMGYTKEEFLSRSCLDNVHPDDREYVAARLISAIKENTAGSIKYRCLKKDGSYLWLETSGKMYESPDGTSGVILISRDIERRKLIEQKLRRQVEYQNSLINNMNEWLFSYDANSRLTYANRKAIESTGYSMEELQTMSLFDLAVPEQHEFVAKQVEERFKLGVSNNYELFVKFKNGQETLLRIKSTPITDYSNSEVNSVLVLAEDISEQRRMEKEMTRLSQLYTVGGMAAGNGYEIRNPLASVRGFLQLLQKSGDFAQYNRYFENMLEELDRTNLIISEFLLQAQNRIIDLQQNDLNQIIKSLYPFLKADAVMGDKTIVLELGKIPEIFLNKREIRQLIINLVHNRLEASPPGGNVKISTWWQEDEVILEVIDQGETIDPEASENCGTQFLVGKEDTEMELVICLGVAARHQARIEIINSDGKNHFQIRFKVSGKSP